MDEYRRRYGSDVWHWKKKCSNYPTENFVDWFGEEGDRPSSGELCDECQAKEREAS